MKYVLPVSIIVLAASGLAVWLIGNSLMLGIALVSLSLILWAFAPSTIGRLGTGHRHSGGIDAKQVKQYRVDHPGATIADGVRATHH